MEFNADELTKALAGQAETVSAPGVIKAVFKVSDIKEDFAKLYEVTKQPTLLEAIEQGHFAIKVAENQDKLYRAITLYRCWAQGSLEPPTDLNKLYQEARQEVDLKNSQTNNNDTGGVKR